METLLFPLSCDDTLAWCENHQKPETSNLHNVTFDDADAAVDEAETEQACIIYYLSEQKVNLIVSYKYIHSH